MADNLRANPLLQWQIAANNSGRIPTQSGRGTADPPTVRAGVRIPPPLKLRLLKQKDREGKPQNMNWLNDIIGVINNYLWSYVLIVMLIGIGLWFTVRTRFV